MAKLSANGIEIVRYRTSDHCKDFGRTIVREFSLRSNGWVLVKVQYTDGSWNGWKRWARVGESVVGSPATVVRKNLERRHETVEEVTQ